MRFLLSMYALTLLLSCSSRSDEAAPARASETRAVPSTGAAVTTPGGEVIQVEVAANAETRQRGLMFRDSLAPDRGMLFIFTDAGVHGFWMKNTLIPLDILWLDSAGKIVFISANTPPCEADPCPSYVPDEAAKYVLELAGGRAAQLGLKVGDTLRLSGLAAYRVE